MNTVFVDVDTQLDFVFPAGALYVPGAERILQTIAKLNRFAAAHGIPVISTADAHAENDSEFASWPPHCVAGTTGQRKAEATLLERRVVIPNRACDPALDGARQIILEKQTVNAFEALNLPVILRRLGAERYVVYGVVTEICVAHAVRGLLKTKAEVIVATDAIETLKAEDSSRALEELCAGGARLARVDEIVAA
jgi:nicotinamidase/pyrazinamidase